MIVRLRTNSSIFVDTLLVNSRVFSLLILVGHGLSSTRLVYLLRGFLLKKLPTCGFITVLHLCV